MILQYYMSYTVILEFYVILISILHDPRLYVHHSLSIASYASLNIILDIKLKLTL